MAPEIEPIDEPTREVPADDAVADGLADADADGREAWGSGAQSPGASCLGVELPGSPPAGTMEAVATADFERIPSAPQRLPEHARTAAGIRVCTWNVAECDADDPADEELREWLGIAESPEVVAVGLQEVDMSVKALFGHQGRGDLWERRLTEFLGKAGLQLQGPRRQLMGLLLLVFVRRELLPAVTNVDGVTCPVGWLGVAGNKGGVLHRFALRDRTYCFVNSHLAAHAENVERRNEDYHAIHAKAVFGCRPFTILSHDYVFWFGDLNYRIDIRRELFDQLMAEEEPEALLQYDQLCRQRREKLAFGVFHEAAITWIPTFKYRGREFSEHRLPSYCDRVLWFERDHVARHARCPPEGADLLDCAACLAQRRVRCVAYQSYSELWCSDHKPVAASFVVDDALGGPADS